ncbi:MAG: SufD family Fe-S cluster assembly protein [Thermoleophilaceae bacterium]|nr:SufD family Fe-S cluster assembly protein [Thermoleophilaceae bacterium]
MPPSFLEERRKAALEVYEREPIPTWRRSGFWTTSLRKLRLDELGPRRYDPVASLDELSPVVTDALRGEELAGLIVQRGASTVYTEVDPALAGQGLIVMPLEQAVEEHTELVERWYMKRLSEKEGKFPAASAAFWTGGAFVYVPRDIAIDKPLQVVYLIDEPGTAQYAHTLAIVDEGSKAYLREYCLAPDFEGQALHAGGFELYCRPSSNVKLAHLQDWGAGEVHDISTKRVEIAADAHCGWVPIYLGGRLTKQTLDIITAERGADMRHNGLYFTERDEHLDVFTTDLHEQGHTTGDTVFKGALTGESRASYEGLIEIVHGAQETNTYLQTHSMLLSPKAKADAIPSLIVKTDSVSASHGGTVGEIDEEQVFYMQTRGVPRLEAIRILVEGYFEEIVQKLDDEVLEAVVRERIAGKLTEAAAEVEEYIAQR